MNPNNKASTSTFENSNLDGVHLKRTIMDPILIVAMQRNLLLRLKWNTIVTTMIMTFNFFFFNNNHFTNFYHVHYAQILCILS